MCVVCKHQTCRARSTGLDSLIRLLLGVDCIQPTLINHLFEKLFEFMDNPTATRYCVCVCGCGCGYVHACVHVCVYCCV